MFTKLGEISIITMGQSPESKFYNMNNSGIPFLQGNRTFGFKYPKFDTYTTKVTKLAQKGDILMSVRAPVGDLNYAPVDLCIGRGLCSIRAKEGFDQDYIYYLLRYNLPLLLNMQNGTTFGSINSKEILNLKVNIHNEYEQLKISKIFTTIDEKIELNNKINDNLFC